MIYFHENNLLSVRFSLENSLPKMGEGMKKEYIYMPKQLNCLGPTESGSVTDGRSKNWTFALESVLPPSSWWGSRTTEAPRCGAGRFGAAFPWLSWVPPSPAHLAGTVWHCTRSSSPSGGSAASALGTMRLFLTVHALGFRAPTPRLPRRSRLSEGPADWRTCPTPGLLSQTRSMACDFRTRRTHGPLCDLHLENFPDHASALWFTPCRRRLTCRKASESLSGGWAGLPPPSPASLLFWETIVGVPTSPKLPPLNEAGGRGAASWLNKAETPVCQKQADGDRPICAARFSRSWGCETHLSQPKIPLVRILPSPLQFFCSAFLSFGASSTQGWTCHAKTNLVHLKGLKGSCISGDISPAFLTHPALLCGLEGHPEREAKPSSVFPEPLSSKACPPCDGCGSFAPVRCALSFIHPENIYWAPTCLGLCWGWEVRQLAKRPHQS